MRQRNLEKNPSDYSADPKKVQEWLDMTKESLDIDYGVKNLTNIEITWLKRIIEGAMQNNAYAREKGSKV